MAAQASAAAASAASAAATGFAPDADTESVAARCASILGGVGADDVSTVVESLELAADELSGPHADVLRKNGLQGAVLGAVEKLLGGEGGGGGGGGGDMLPRATVVACLGALIAVVPLAEDGSPDPEARAAAAMAARALRRFDAKGGNAADMVAICAAASALVGRGGRAEIAEPCVIRLVAQGLLDFSSQESAATDLELMTMVQALADVGPAALAGSAEESAVGLAAGRALMPRSWWCCFRFWLFSAGSGTALR